MDTLPTLTVSEFTSILKTTVEESFFGVSIEGEISDFKKSSSGHWYFSLKDENALIRAVVWKNTTLSIGFVPENGLKVTVYGNITIYPASGSYQIACFAMRLSGNGNILAILEQRKKYYNEAGYFSQEHKKSIPKRPSKIAIITSETGAALQDILQILQRRNSSIDIVILPAMVQGDAAGETIANRIKQVNDFMLADVMIVGRGGGSIEDLLPFSEDCVIQAIYDSQIPVISAVGHEIDWALSDFVADLRAPTPSAAAELVCESQTNQKHQLDLLVNSMKESVLQRANAVRMLFNSKNPAFLRYVLENKISHLRMDLESSRSGLSEFKNKVAFLRSRIEIAKSQISAASPLDVLNRGYSIVTNSSGKTVKNIDMLNCNDDVKLTFSNGYASAVVKSIRKNNS